MSVIRQLNNPARDFQMVPRRLVQLGLSAEAVGLMLVVACAPPEVDLSAEWIGAQCGCGRDKRQRIMRELVGASLLRVVREQAADGLWRTAYVFDWARLLAPEPGNPVSVSGNRSRETRRRKTRLSREPGNPVLESENKGGTAVAPQGEAAAVPPRVTAESEARSPAARSPAESGERPDGDVFDAKAAQACSLGLRYRNRAGEWVQPGSPEFEALALALRAQAAERRASHALAIS